MKESPGWYKDKGWKFRSVFGTFLCLQTMHGWAFGSGSEVFSKPAGVSGLISRAVSHSSLLSMAWF